MTLLLLLGCATLVEGHCESDPHEVDDDEAIARDFTVAGALREIEPQTVATIDLFGDPVPVELVLTRGEGAAFFDDEDAVEEVVRPGGRNTRVTWIGPDCEDAVEVPVVLTFAGDAVAVSGPTDLWVNLSDSRSFVPTLTYTLDPALDTLPPGLGGAPVSGTIRARFIDGVVANLEAIVVTEAGTQETVLWYGAP